jgi:hypothetical protein
MQDSGRNSFCSPCNVRLAVLKKVMNKRKESDS